MELPQIGAGASSPGGEVGVGALPLSGGGGGMSDGGVGNGSSTGADVQPKERKSKAATRMAANVARSMQAP